MCPSEDAELLPLVEGARAEWEEDGGVEVGRFFRQLAEEEKAQGQDRAVQG